MDGGMRAPRPVERRASAARPEPAYRQPEEKETPKAVHRAPVHRAVKEEKSGKRWMWPIIVAVLVIVLGVGGWFGWSRMNAGAPAIDGSKYQAVFFTNGQVYFGKLHPASGGYMKLTDVFYLQSQSSGDGSSSNNPQQAAGNKGNVQLIKLGDEIHGPEDEMIIAKNQMLFYENLKSDGKVAQSIAQYKNK